MENQLSFLSLNVRGLRDYRKRIGLFNWLKRIGKSNSFILLQETHSSVEDEKVWSREWGQTIHFSHGDRKSRGVAILNPHNNTLDVEKIQNDEAGRLLSLKIETNTSPIFLFNVYVPNQVSGNVQPLQTAFLDKIKTLLNDYSENSIIIGGDLNTALDPNLDKYRNNEEQTANEKTIFAKQLLSLCEKIDLVDSWRTLNPNLRRFTWRQTNPLRQSRLDYWLISSHLLKLSTEIDIIPSFKSDHSAITLTFSKVDRSKTGPGLWKFNNKLLQDVTYITKTRQQIEELKTNFNAMADKCTKWELIKYELRKQAIKYSKEKNKEKRELFASLSRQALVLEQKLSESPSEEIIEQHHHIKQDLESIITEDAQSAAFRSKAKYVESGETNLKYYKNLEKRNYEHKLINNLTTESGQTITGKKEIEKEITDFYSKLYESKNVDEEVQNAFLNENVPRLQETQRDECEKEISINELGKALKLLPNGKTPGTDGFTTNFYKFWWPYIKDLVCDSLQHAKSIGHLSTEQRRGVITLTPKKNKDTRQLKNWRPISLLNTDYKILTKLLAIRLQKVLDCLIHPDQVGYIKGRYIGQNIRTIMDIIEYTNRTHSAGLVAFLDFEKAFDSLEWSFIKRALQTFGFGPTFCQWVTTIYTDISSSVLNNGYTTEYFNLKRGIRQGCPLSAYLFILSVEYLACSIRNDDQIKGIKIANTEIKIVQMADDTTIFLQDSTSLKQVLQKIYLFSKAAGLKLNKTKTEAMWLGSNRNNTNHMVGLDWKTEVYALGIWFCTDTEAGVERNVGSKFDKFCRALNMWRPLNLSIKGKIHVIKTMALPILLYVTSNLPICKPFIDKVNSEMYKFIWSNKPEKIKRKVLTSDIPNGGLKMLDLQSMVKAQKVMWIKRLMTEKNESWKTYPLWCLGPLGTSLFKCNISETHIPLNLPTFYKEILLSWINCKNSEPVVDSAWDIRRQSIFYNKNIKIANEYIRTDSLDWFKQGIFCVHDILNSNGDFLTMNDLHRLYNVRSDILSYNSVKDAIPAAWRQQLKQTVVTREAINSSEGLYLIDDKKQFKPLSLLTNKKVYSHLKTKIEITPNCIQKWTSHFGDIPDWSQIFQLSFLTTRSVSLQILQYKILHRIYPCNYWVSKWEPNTSVMCSNCNVPDTLEHYFHECNIVQPLWSHFSNWWQTNMGARLTLTVKDTIFGMPPLIDENKSLNLCLLLAKDYIQKQKREGAPCSLYNLLFKIKHFLLVERHICTENQTIPLYLQWYEELENALG